MPSDAKEHPGTLLQVDGLQFAHAGQPALFDRWQARISPGLTWVVGGEGRGKTTLLSLLAGMLTPASGSLCIDAFAAARDPQGYRGQVFLADPRNPDHDALPAADLMARIAARYPRFDHASLPGHVAGLGLEPHWHKPLHMLSSGSRHKVWHAAALACEAPLRLLDQPFAALDRASIQYLVQVLRDASHRRGAAWVVADYAPHPSLADSAIIDLGD